MQMNRNIFHNIFEHLRHPIQCKHFVNCCKLIKLFFDHWNNFSFIKSIVFIFRNTVYNLSISDFTEQRRLVWHSPENDVKMCVMKGKDDVSIIIESLDCISFRFAFGRIGSCLVWCAFVLISFVGLRAKHCLYLYALVN